MLTPRPHRADLGFLLAPGERPRQAYPWKIYTSCPHCGSKGGWGQNDIMGHCIKCSTWVWKDPPIPWQRINNKALCRKNPRRKEIIITCQVCGKEFGTHNHNGRVKFCPDCRDEARAAHQRELDRQRKGRKRKSKLLVTPDGGHEVCVKTVVATNPKSIEKGELATV